MPNYHATLTYRPEDPVLPGAEETTDFETYLPHAQSVQFGYFLLVEAFKQLEYEDLALELSENDVEWLGDGSASASIGIGDASYHLVVTLTGD